MLIGLKDASSTPFATLDDLYTWVCREKGVVLEKNVSEILELCKRMDSRLGAAVVEPSKKSYSLPQLPDEGARLLNTLPKSEPVQVNSEMTIEEKLRCINDFNVPSQAVPISYTEYKKARDFSDKTASSYFPKEFPKADEELDKDQEMSKADAMNRLLDLQANGTKPKLGGNELRNLRNWFLLNGAEEGCSVDKYFTHYCLNIFLRLYDGKEETVKLHNFPPTISLPAYLKDFHKYSFFIEETPTTYNNIVKNSYFKSYQILHEHIMKGCSLDFAQAHKLAYSIYTHVHMNRVSIMSLEPWVLCFLETLCKKEDEESTKSSILYSKFVEWFEAIWDTTDTEFFDTYRYAIKSIVSQKAFTSILKSSAGLKPIRKSDGIYWPGIGLGPGEKIEPPLFIVGGYQDKEYGSPI